jgi:exosortase
MTATTQKSPISWKLAAPLLAAAVLLCLMYRETMQSWWDEWTAPGSFYAHAMFVPFFSAAMIWQNRKRVEQAPHRPSWLGGAVLFFGILVFLVAQRLDVVAVKSFSVLFVIVGFALLTLGIPKTKVILFPLIFLIMMMPLLPDQIINGIAFPIQVKSAQLATSMLNLIQLKSVCEGTTIKMETYSMAVELPCSGFKTLISLMTFTAAYSHLVEGELWKRITLFVVTMPLSLFINGLRIAFIGIVGELISKEAAAVFHDYSGFIVLTLAFLFLFNFSRVLKCRRFLGLPLTDEEEVKDAALYQARKGKTPEPEWWQELLTWRPGTDFLRRAMPCMIGLNVIILLGVGLKKAVTLPINPDPPIATFQVPFEFDYDGVHYSAPTHDKDPQVDRLTHEAAEALSPTRVINRIYQGSDGSVSQFFMTSGSGRKTFHDPHSCMLGSNAALTDVGTPDLPTPLGPVKVQESTYQIPGETGRNEFMFCYVVEGRILQDKYQIRNAIMRQMIIGDSGRPSYFLRFIPTNPSASEATKRKQIVHFIAGMWNAIGPILKGDKKGVPDNSPITLPEKNH